MSQRVLVRSAGADVAPRRSGGGGSSSSQPPGFVQVCTTSGAAAYTSSCLSLQDLTLLRGAQMADVMSCFGWVLGTSTPTEAHYQLSAPVGNIDAFISHNWSTPQRDKFLALALHYNWFTALLASSAVAVVAFGATCFGALPLIERMALQHTHVVHFSRGIWCQVFGMGTLILVFCFKQDFARLFRCKGPTVFLDRTCVCQTNPELKRMGIESLAAFLANSCSMVVLYSDVYLQKLWTVYEVATFMFLFPSGRLLFQPVIFPKVVFSGMFFVSLTRFSFFICSIPGVQEPLVHRGIPPWLVENVLSYLLLWPWMIGLTTMLRGWAREQAQIKSRLHKFTIKDANCLSEDDRRLIERNVAVFSIHFGLVEPGAPQERALMEFDAMIHRKVPRFLLASLGPTGVPYRFSVTMFVVYAFLPLDITAAEIHSGQAGFPVVYGNVLYCLIITFGVGPLSIALCSWMSAKVQASCAKATTGVVSFIVWLFYVVSLQCFWYLTRNDHRHMVLLSTLAALVVVGVVYAVYRLCHLCDYADDCNCISEMTSSSSSIDSADEEEDSLDLASRSFEEQEDAASYGFASECEDANANAGEAEGGGVQGVE